MSDKPVIDKTNDGSNGVGLALAAAHLESGGLVGIPPYAACMRSHATKYKEEYARSALDAMESGMTLREHCRMMQKTDSSFPGPSTIFAWATDNVQGFSSRFAYARRMQLHHWAEEIVEIAEDGRNDYMDRRRRDGTIERVIDHECVQRSKLRCDTRRWLLSKLVPEFADKVTHQQLGAHGQPVDPPSAINPIDLSVELRGWKPRE